MIAGSPKNLSGSRALLRWLRSFGIALLIVGPVAANAEERGKDDLHAKLDSFVVNLRGATPRYLQVDITLNTANALAVEKVKMYMPVIRHQLILLLTSKDASTLGTTGGKMRLMQEARDAANAAISQTEQEGVTDVLFTAFVIQ